MKHIYFVLVTLLFCSVQTIAQQSNIPSDQKLYIDFNGGINDNSGGNFYPSTTNISFESDRNGSPSRSGKFGGCSQLSHIQVYDSNPHQLDFSTGGTISLWAKPTLNSSMDPSTGQCVTNGRHTFFAKGGDGYNNNSPQGFYAFTSISNGTQTIGFGSSANAGNSYHQFAIPYTDTWHHYTFAFTATNVKIYVDGVQKADVVFNLNFNVINSQLLYIGTLGPKTNPELGITYWFPFGGLMDEFRLFTKTLTPSEVQKVFNESYDLIAPAVQRKIFVAGQSGYYSGVSGSMFENRNNTIVLSNRNTRYSFFTSDGWDATKLTSYSNNGQVVWENEIINQFNTNAYNTVSASMYVLGDSLETLIELNRIQGGGGRFLIIDNATGLTKADVSLGNEKIVRAYKFYQEFILVLRKNSSNDKDFLIKRYDKYGTLLASLSLDDSYIKDFSWSLSQGIVLTGTTKSYIVNIPSLSYTQLSTSGKICKWVGSNIIISDDSHTYRISQSYTYTSLANGLRNIDILRNGEYIVHGPNDLKRYSSNHVLQQTVNSINEDVKLFPYSNKLYTTNSQQVKIYDIQGNFLWQTRANSNFSVSIKEHKDLGIYIFNNNGFTSEVIRTDDLGKRLWKKQYNNTSFILTDMENTSSNLKFLVTSRMPSYIGGGTNSNLYLVNLVDIGNPCDYNLSTNLKDSFCQGEHIAYPKFGEVSLRDSEGLPNDVIIKWKRGNIDVTNYGSYQFGTGTVTESGIYKLTVKQGVCEKSVEKYVNVSSAFNPLAPTLATTYNPICEGDTTTITATNCAGSIEWNAISYNDYNGNTAKVYPMISKDYTANCYTPNSQYGNCRSANSLPLTVNVTTLPEVIGLAGSSPLSETYRAEKINSTQNVIINSMIDYKSKKSIELKPGFSTAANAVFNAKIVSSCVE